MEISAILLTLGVALLVGFYLYAPFLERQLRLVTREEHELSILLAERDRVLSALQELDFDFQLGKIPEEDYPTQRANLLQKGAEILKKLDELTPQVAQINAETHLKRGSASTKKRELSDDEIESLIAARRKQHKTKSAGFCPKCGKPILTSDRFCPSCGKPLV
ncbi:MAG TPA: zinc ribbon domain-containing protein [Anaerolineales bacterium]|nr:zinc ribbon domain-containing protein [Anaerolineales bacterium]